ncbi:3-isopropylmalate dehydratase [Dactylosporangium sp. CA-233914]|uniref:LeuD/DmdB family oxidoreductase small subunit n=1 Tax=Dactylosporangium sp. CA-233914 TaxID=3239934 RepID=UPI003D938625
MRFRGRAWCFGDHMNTDLMLPNTAYRVPAAQRPGLVFSANRPGWAQQVEPGDLIVAGRNFGCGSGRPVSTILVELGIAGVVAESVNGLFFRSAVNAGLPILECPGIASAVAELDEVSADLASGEVINCRDGNRLAGRAVPPELLEIVSAGGVLPRLARDGYIVLPESGPASRRPAPARKGENG